MDAVGAVDVGVPWRPEHHRVALGAPAVGVRRRVGVVVGFDLDDHAADSVDGERCADQVGRHRVDAAIEEFAAEPMTGHGGVFDGRRSRRN